MADDQTSLAITITGDSAPAQTAVSEVLRRMEALELKFATTGAAGVKMGATIAEGANVAAKGMEHGTEAALGFSEGLKIVANHSLTAARGFEVLGLEGDAAASKLAGLAEVAESVEASFAPLLLLAAVLATVSAGFSFLKESVADAAALQTQMRQLQIAVKDQGGSWAEAKEQIEGFVKSEGELTGFTHGALRASLTEAAVAGHDMSDSMQIVAVSEEVAKARGMDLAEVTQRIIDAEAGRTRGLIQLDPRLKDFIAKHHDMSSILTQLARDMAGQATGAADTYAVAVGRLNNAWEEFREEVGTWLLPWLTSVIDKITDLVSQMRHVATAIHTLQDNAGKEAEIDQAEADGNMTVAEGNKLKAKLTSKSSAAAWDELKHPDVASHKDSNERRYQADQRHKKLLEGVHLDQNPQIGKAAKTGATSSVSIDQTAVDLAPDKIDAIAEAQKRLQDHIELLNAGEALLTVKIGGATTAAEKQALTIVYNAKVIADLKDKNDLLGNAVANGSVEQSNLKNKVDSARASYIGAVDAINSFKASASNDGSIVASNRIGVLKDAVDKSKTAWENSKSALDQNTRDLHSNTLAYAANDDALRDHLNAQAKITEALDEFNHKERERLIDSVSTFEATNRQKVAFYQTALRQLNTADLDYQKRYEEIAKKITDAEIAELEDRLKQRKDFITKAQGIESTFIDDLVSKHMSLKDSLKHVWDDILKDYISMIEQMIVKSAVFNTLNSSLASAFGLGGGSGNSGSGGSSLIAAGASIFGGSSSSTLPGTVGLTSDTIAKITGSPEGVSALSTFGSGGTSGGGGLFGGAGAGGFAGLASSLGVGAAAFGVGSALAGGSGSKSMFGGLGALAGVGVVGSIAGAGLIGGAGAGLAGGIPALLAAGPAGWAVLAGAAVLGGAAGGMFGSKGPNAHDNPDQAGDVASYGQFVSNINGLHGTFGNTTADPTAQYNPGLGGTSESKQLLAQLLAIKAQGASAPSQLSAEAQQLLALTGGQTSGDPFHIANEKNGVFTLGSGQQIDVSTFMAQVNKFQTDSSASGQTNPGSIPTFSISRTYGDANIANAPQQTGTTTSGVFTPAPGVTVDMRGATIVGPGGLAEAAKTIGTAFQQQNRGTQPGSYVSSIGRARFQGDGS